MAPAERNCHIELAEKCGFRQAQPDTFFYKLSLIHSFNISNHVISIGAVCQKC